MGPLLHLGHWLGPENNTGSLLTHEHGDGSFFPPHHSSQPLPLLLLLLFFLHSPPCFGCPPPPPPLSWVVLLLFPPHRLQGRIQPAPHRGRRSQHRRRCRPGKSPNPSRLPTTLMSCKLMFPSKSPLVNACLKIESLFAIVCSSDVPCSLSD